MGKLLYLWKHKSKKDDPGQILKKTGIKLIYEAHANKNMLPNFYLERLFV